MIKSLLYKILGHHQNVSALEYNEDITAFIREHAPLKPLSPFLPEIVLHQAQQMEELWQLLQSLAGDPELPPPFWAFAWAGGQGLARYVLDHPELVAGKRVLDFASGSGLVAIAAAKAGAARVLVCDIDPLANYACAANARENTVFLEELTLDDLKTVPKDIDVILAGDVCYEYLMAHRVVAWLRLCAAAGIKVLLGDPGRAYAPKENVTVLATYIVPTSLAIEEQKEREVQILTLLS